MFGVNSDDRDREDSFKMERQRKKKREAGRKKECIKFSNFKRENVIILEYL